MSASAGISTSAAASHTASHFVLAVQSTSSIAPSQTSSLDGKSASEIATSEIAPSQTSTTEGHWQVYTTSTWMGGEFPL